MIQDFISESLHFLLKSYFGEKKVFYSVMFIENCLSPSYVRLNGLIQQLLVYFKSDHRKTD